ncbi:MAG: BMFP domain-containing protein YqiC [Porticoccus sp.]|jgi:BMFP domain-containing protein YqiC
MKPDELLDQFLHQLNSVLKPGAEALGSEFQQKMRTAAQAAFDKLDLVTRDQFDAQHAVLARTREKLDALEKQLTELESHVSGK